jgi:two-component system NtrC family response regulator
MQASPSSRPKLLVADDDENLCRQLQWALEKDYAIHIANTPARIREIFANGKPALMLLDLNFTVTATDGREGIQLIHEILGKHPGVKIIVITGNQDWEVARQALSAGAHDHLVKPLVLEELKVLLRRAFFLAQIEKEKTATVEECFADKDGRNIVAASPQMRSIFALVEQISQTDATVLITGESGTGKELVAGSIHHRSPRRRQKFVPINCGAIPDNLLESELFGHERGAFTGAVALRKGKFEAADGGTIFLDEIGELTAPLQVKILRFLQDHAIERVGGNTPIPLDVRILAATNRNLQKEIQRGNFREDLYYRLNVVSIEVPPLRVRSEDIDHLAQHFLKNFSKQYNKSVRDFSPAARKIMREYGWPGNVRELENKIRKAVILARHSVILPEDLAIEPVAGKRRNSLRESVAKLERETVLESLRRHRGIVAHVAAELDITRVALYDLLKKHKIDHHDFKADPQK